MSLRVNGSSVRRSFQYFCLMLSSSTAWVRISRPQKVVTSLHNCRVTYKALHRASSLPKIIDILDIMLLITDHYPRTQSEQQDFDH